MIKFIYSQNKKIHFKWRLNKSYSDVTSFGFKDKSFGEFVEISRFFQGDDKLGVDGFSVSSFNVLWSDVLNGGQTVLDEDLSELADKWDAFSHTFNLSRPMLFDDKLGKEQSLIQSCISSDSENVSFVELWALGSH